MDIVFAGVHRSGGRERSRASDGGTDLLGVGGRELGAQDGRGAHRRRRRRSQRQPNAAIRPQSRQSSILVRYRSQNR